MIYYQWMKDILLIFSLVFSFVSFFTASNFKGHRFLRYDAFVLSLTLHNMFQVAEFLARGYITIFL